MGTGERWGGDLAFRTEVLAQEALGPGRPEGHRLGAPLGGINLLAQ
jgi:hypothetical protein